MDRDKTTQQPYLNIPNQYFDIGFVNTNTGERIENAFKWNYLEATLKTYWCSDEVFTKFLQGEIELPSNIEGEDNVRYFVCWKRRAK